MIKGVGCNYKSYLEELFGRAIWKSYLKELSGIIMLLRMYNLELYTATTKITEGTKGICYGLCALCVLCGIKLQK